MAFATPFSAAAYSASHLVGVIGSHALNPWIRDFEYALNAAHQTVYPSAQEILKQYACGRLSDFSMQKVLGFYGVNASKAHAIDPMYKLDGSKLAVGEWSKSTQPDQWVNAVEMAHWTPPLATIYDFLNRGLVSTECALYWIRRLGIRDQSFQQRLLFLRRDVPGQQELIRNLKYLSPTVGYHADKYGLSAGYSDIEAAWLSAAGLGKVSIGNTSGTGYEWMDTARLAWEQQWEWPSVSDAMQMLHRLRPTGGIGGGPRDPGGEVFLPEDAEPIFRQSRIPPYWDKKTIAINYRPLSRFQIAKALLYKHITIDEAGEYFLDLGYNNRDAKLMALQTDRDVRLKATFRATELTRGKIEDAVRVGTIDDAMANSMFEQLGFTADEAAQAVNAVRLEINTSVVKAAVAHVTTHVCHGVISAAEGHNQLVEIGLTADAIAWKEQEWATCLTTPHKELTAGNICTLMSDGFITIPVAITRLEHLGYGLLDAEAFLLPCISRLNDKLKRAALALIKSKDKAAKDAAKVIADEKKAIKEHQAELARHSAPGMIRRWLGEELISEADAYARLAALGWPIDDSTRLVDEGLAIAKARKGKASAKTKGSPA